MYKRTRFQKGSLGRKARSQGSDVWEYRYYAPAVDGRRRRKTIMIGTTDQYPTRESAEQVVETLRPWINAGLPVRSSPLTIGGLIEFYIAQELPERHSTQRSYLTGLNKWIGPKWSEYRLEQVKAVAVEQWLRSLSLAPKTKAHIRNLFHLLYENARRWELFDRNPIKLVRQGSRRLKIPRVLRIEEVLRLLEELADPYRTMVLVAACLGLRVSEIIGLQWGDVDWIASTVLVQRSVVQTRVAETKTEYSQQYLPLDPQLTEALLCWKERCFYKADSDWVFASDKGRPRWQETALRRHLQPAAERAGIGKIGWHTFRHTYSTMLRSLGVDLKVQQELLRHADIQTTMNIYTQAVSEAKREGNSKVVRMVLPISARKSNADAKAAV